MLLFAGGCATAPDTYQAQPAQPARPTGFNSNIPFFNYGGAMFAWPVRGAVINYYGSKMDKIINKGIDIRAPEGAIIKASDKGKVLKAVTDFVEKNWKMVLETIKKIIER